MTYALESLYEHQDFDWVVDSIPYVLAWIADDATGDERRGRLFKLTTTRPGREMPEQMEIDLIWSLDALKQRDAALLTRVERLCSSHTVDREHIPENAAYGLALVAISILMPGRRVIHMLKGRAPDFLFDVTPGALRGVEVAGRTSGGFAALRAVRLEKSPKLKTRQDLAEVHLSLWCAGPPVSELHQITP